MELDTADVASMIEVTGELLDRLREVATEADDRPARDLLVRAGCELTVIAPALEINLEGPKRRYLNRQATYNVAVTNPGTARIDRSPV